MKRINLRGRDGRYLQFLLNTDGTVNNKMARLKGGTLSIISDYDENNNLHLVFQGGGGILENRRLWEDMNFKVKKIHFNHGEHVVEFY